MRQHLTAVQAATAICSAEVRGDVIGSTELEFLPGSVQGGAYSFRVGTAGSTMLVLQTIMLPLSLAADASFIELEGGTHNPFAPPFDFLAESFVPVINRLGPRIELILDRPGFYPAGGGRVSVSIEPAARLDELVLTERGKPVSRNARAVVSNLPRHIAERERSVIAGRLGWESSEVQVVEVNHAVGPGNIVTIAIGYENLTEVFTGFGEVGRSAEAVAMRAVQQCQRYLKSTAPAGEFLTDQLMLPLVLAGRGTFRSTGLSSHARTQVELIGEFHDRPIQYRKLEGGSIEVSMG